MKHCKGLRAAEIQAKVAEGWKQIVEGRRKGAGGGTSAGGVDRQLHPISQVHERLISPNKGKGLYQGWNIEGQS